MDSLGFSIVHKGDILPSAAPHLKRIVDLAAQLLPPDHPMPLAVTIDTCENGYFAKIPFYATNSSCRKIMVQQQKEAITLAIHKQ